MNKPNIQKILDQIHLVRAGRGDKDKAARTLANMATELIDYLGYLSVHTDAWLEEFDEKSSEDLTRVELDLAAALGGDREAL